VVVALLGAIAFLGCVRESERHRALLIGVDGATLRLMDPLIKDGRLPNLATIARQGISGPLRSAKPLHSPRIWNTIATGKVAEKHGIASFARKDADGIHHLYLSTDRRTRALWNIASDAGLTVGAVNWWNTYPPAQVNGVIVSDHLIASEVENRRRMTKSASVPAGQVVFPTSWHQKITLLMESSEPLTSVTDPFAGDITLPRWLKSSIPRLSRYFVQDGMVTRIALEVRRAIQPDLLLVYLPGVDRVSHHLWGNIEPAELYPEDLQPSPAAREGGAWALRRYYEYADALIGLLVEGYGPEDLVMVVSDHGFEAGIDLMLLTGVHESEKAIDGVIFARGRGIPAGGRSASMSITDVTPTVLAWLGLPVAEDMDGRPADFLEVPPVQMIATYDTRPVERISEASSGAEEEILEQLRGLGYLE
jgi:predicted AlkP superfamily phosphohydrolase/phosphomutase